MLRVRHYRGDGTADGTADPDLISNYLEHPDGLLWVDVDRPTDAEIDSLVAEFQVHHVTAEDLHTTRQRPKLERAGALWSMVLRPVTLVGTRLAAPELNILFGEGWVVTVRKPAPRNPRLVFDVDELARRVERNRVEGNSPSGATALFLYVLLDIVIDGYLDVTDELEDRVESLEDRIFATGSDERLLQQEMFQLRQSLVLFRKAVAPVRDIVGAMLRGEVDHFPESVLIHFQSIYDHVLRVLDFNETQRDLLTGAFEAQLSIQSNRMNLVMKKMTSWGAILVVASIITGIYGMNFADMPLLEWHWGFYASLGLIAVATSGLYLWFKHRDWM